MNDLAVSPEGPCRSIQEAIERAADGARIVIRPGVYRENLLLARPVHLQGEGEVVVQSEGAPCVRMQTTEATLSGLVLRAGNGEFSAVHIPQGRLTLESCHLWSDAAPCIEVEGETADPVIRNCVIQAAQDFGVRFGSKARGIVEECAIQNCGKSGIKIWDGASPVVRRCKISGGTAAIFATDRGTCVVEECEIFSTKLSGLNSSEGGVLTARRCQIHDTAEHGIRIYKGGSATVEECEVSATGLAGVAVEEGGEATFRRCRISHSKEEGVLVTGEGKSLFEECDISGSAKANVSITARGNPTLRNCRISKAKYAGLLVSNSGKGTVEECEFFENGTVGIEISNAGEPLVQRCKVHRHPYQAIWAHDGGRGTVTGCDLKGNVGYSLAIRDTSKIVQRGNKIRRPTSRVALWFLVLAWIPMLATFLITGWPADLWTPSLEDAWKAAMLPVLFGSGGLFILAAVTLFPEGPAQFFARWLGRWVVVGLAGIVAFIIFTIRYLFLIF
jgi:parallel beta-helix repeat protein